MLLQFDAAAPVVRGFTQADDFSYSILEKPLVSGGTTADLSYFDSTLNYTTGAGVSNNCQLIVSDSTLIPGHSFINHTPSIASIDASGNVAVVSNGTATIDISTPVGVRRIIRSMQNNAADAYTFKQYKTGSVAAAIISAINAMISGKTPGIGAQKFITSNNYNVAAPSVTRNAGLFTGAMDFTAVSVMRGDRSDAKFPILLLSSRHAICASHIRPAIGATIVWQAPDNSYKTANVLDVAFDVNTDIAVLYLSAAITGINPFKFLPSNWQNYLGSLADGTYEVGRIPCLSKLYNPDDTNSYTSCIAITEPFLLASPINSALMTFYQAAVYSGSNVSPAYSAWTDGTLGVRDGDSGSPIMLPINGAPVLVSAHYTALFGYNWVVFSTWIESQMSALAVAHGDNTAYAMLRADLSTFTAYPTI